MHLLLHKPQYSVDYSNNIRDRLLGAYNRTFSECGNLNFTSYSTLWLHCNLLGSGTPATAGFHEVCTLALAIAIAGIHKGAGVHEGEGARV